MKPALLLLVLAATAPTNSGAWIQSAREAHAAADAALASGRPLEARAALAAFLGAPIPGDVARDDSRAIAQDAWFRVADLDIALGQHAAARADASSGLAMGRRDDVFTANLLVVRGHALELLGDDRGAISDYQEAMRINGLLLEAAAEGR